MLRKKVNLTMSNGQSFTKEGILSDDDLKILWLSRTLSDIDYRYEPEFLRLRQSLVHRDLKRVMREALISTYRKKTGTLPENANGLARQAAQVLC